MLRDQILEELLPLAQSGLQRLGAWGSYTTQALAIVDRRVAGGQTGAAWQRHYVDRHGADAGALTMAYAARQRDDTPVHEWPA
jgi:hypothetical protein